MVPIANIYLNMYTHSCYKKKCTHILIYIAISLGINLISSSPSPDDNSTKQNMIYTWEFSK